MGEKIHSLVIESKENRKELEVARKTAFQRHSGLVECETKLQVAMDEIESLRSVVIMGEIGVEESNKRIADLTHNVESLQMTESELITKLESQVLEIQLGEIGVEESSKRIEQLETEIKHLRLSIEASEQDKKVEIEALQQELLTQKEKNGKLVDSMSSSKLEVQSKLEKIMNTIESLKAKHDIELQELSREHIGEIKKCLDEAKSVKEKHEMELHTALSKIESAKIEVRRRLANCDKMGHFLARFFFSLQMSLIHSSLALRLCKQLAESNNNIRETKYKLANHDAELDELRTLLEKETKEKHHLKVTLESTNSLLEKSKASLSSLSVELQAKEFAFKAIIDKNDTSKQTCSEQADEIVNLRAKIEALQATHDHLETDHKNHTKQLDASFDSNSELTATIAQLELKIEENHNLLEKKDEKIINLESEIKMAEGVLEDFQTWSNTAQQEVLSREDCINELKQEAVDNKVSILELNLRLEKAEKMNISLQATVEMQDLASGRVQQLEYELSNAKSEVRRLF